MTLTRRTFLTASAASAVCRGNTEYRLIAHRGGIVDEAHPENSPGSIQAAIDRGYWMLEVDIRRTADGEPILQHDPTFQRYYGVNKPVAELTWSEVKQLRSTPGDTSPIHFRDVCRMCQGKVRLMLDIKSDRWPAEFYQSLVSILDEHQLLQTAYLLGSDRIKRFFRGKCKLSCNRTTLKAAVERGEDVAANYFLFELGSVLDEAAIELCRANRVVPVAAINEFRYVEAHRDVRKGAEEDVARLKRLGVTHYQIDSRYQDLFW